MTIKQVKAKVTERDLQIKSVFVQVSMYESPVRLIKVGRKFLTIMKEGYLRIIDPSIVTEIRT